MTAGRTASPAESPTAAAIRQHTADMNRYLPTIAPLPIPSDLRQPMSERSSSIILVIVVMTTSADTSMKNTGNTAVITETFSQ